MNQLKYAISVSAPIITALLLILLAVFSADLIITFINSDITTEIIETLKKQTTTGAWAITGAVIGSIISILLLATYEGAKRYFFLVKTDASVINSVINELDICCEYIKACKEHLENEIDVINNSAHKTLIAPPPRIEITIWELLKSHTPIAISKNTNLLSGMRILDCYITSFNHQLDSREQYHIHCGINTNYRDDMRIYDNDLLSKLPQLQELAESVLKEVKHI